MRKVLITGASGDIGKAVVFKFISEGYFVIAMFNKDVKSIAEIENKLKELNKTDCFVSYSCDFACEEETVKTLENLKKSFRIIDVLVNCAGVSLIKQINDTTLKEWNKVFDINVKGVYLTTNAVLEGMIEVKKGAIVNVSSIWGDKGASLEVCYSASKGAIIAYTKALAKEVGYSGIRVNCVLPGVIDTKMNNHLSESELNDLKEQTPLYRIGKPEDVANAVYFLSSESADFITGQILTVDGGFTL